MNQFSTPHTDDDFTYSRIDDGSLNDDFIRSCEDKDGCVLVDRPADEPFLDALINDYEMLQHGSERRPSRTTLMNAVVCGMHISVIYLFGAWGLDGRVRKTLEVWEHYYVSLDQSGHMFDDTFVATRVFTIIAFIRRR